ncbi:hypothetical protein E2C01_092992 [Portunus trituberculatus]|uniref:Uncharacterized protein n=1 Tax=Portunus trituberculatus TaxID=210409 RepID=A0A5B7JXF8_PORTR|nr:hypothetical protein [Portunus trituberculatus]
MRMLGLSVWLFLNLVFLGMGSYLYLLWVQYWRYARASQMSRSQDASWVEGKTLLRTQPINFVAFVNSHGDW